eukprot:Plantae.Rhodophyta-Purpureofilum_apyrenoidigerum.ctg23741.p1 GENE.Plantae.Rhodophyta-Purpureofilum_apyrenoidigerum.ctg23741~~Plantae.Rhodophyta-Purpureofilum_apyrenoidigerum.ctg23741.p1  ORF type:complete len:250 (-),score=33.20 Plantae.Rhodophyta-Purpureofilum_apyrenoidigerum.ctg23741:103-852(-)
MAFVSGSSVGVTRRGHNSLCRSLRSWKVAGQDNCFVQQRRRYVFMMAEATKKVFLAIGNGSEEIEATTIADTLVRAGAEVTIASVEETLTCKMSRGVKIQADKFVKDCVHEEYDLIALPGGMPGAERLRDCKQLFEMLLRHNESGKLIGAICAAPAVVLAHHGFLDSKTATCYPSPNFTKMIKSLVDDDDRPVVVDGNMLTSRGPGTALVFSLALVERLFGDPKAEEIASLMLLDLREDWTHNSQVQGA